MSTSGAIGRRTAIKLGLAGAATALAPRRARAQNPKEVKIALVVPLSGPWARQGILEQMGAEMAIDDVNSSGGIKALGGAKLKLVPTTPATARRRPRTPRSAWWRRSPTWSAASAPGSRASPSR